MPASAVTKSIPSVEVSDGVTVAPAVINKPVKASATSAQTFEKVYGVLNVAGLGFLVPLLRIARGENTSTQLKQFWKLAGVPVVAMLVFMLAWSQMSSRIVTSLGQIPGPSAVWHQVGVLWADHNAERAKRDAFYERQEKRNADKLAADPQAEISKIKYTGKPTYFDQIVTSLKTVFTGFVLASMVAIPLGILCGLSSTMNAAINPFIQIFKPVSPLAWLPIVTMVVSALYVTNDPMFEKSFITSAITVALCSLWPTLINTALGVASIDKDLLNVAKVLQLKWSTKLFKLVIPSSLPLIFTGLRLSLGVGWMVLIAAEMLAQNPGLGKFVWDEFQNGSSDSLSRLMVAVFTIGIIGFLLDRVMFTIQTLVDFSGRR
ncbi:MAG TPA: ABC transporter permease [Steroidobacteraceae bacterium]|nr:ABC transporter permease [Steroidobacteraceae bacterium]